MREPVDVLRVLQGRATWPELHPLCGRAAVRRALAQGRIVRAGRGRYVLPGLAEPLTVAASLGGVLSHASAAQHLGLALVRVPDLVHVTVPRAAHRTAPPGVALHRVALGRGEASRASTSVLRTVLDCALTLPFAEALAVADSVLHRELAGPEHLRELAERRRGPGRARLARVIGHAHPDAANAFESAVRAALLDAGLTGFVPQLRVHLPGYGFATIDLGDPVLRVALEADSYAYHGGRAAFRADCRRYNALVRAGWLVLRIPWEDAMFDTDGVSRLVASVCALRPGPGACRTPLVG